MLLVTFHGGKGGVNNVYGYSTKSLPQAQPQTTTALSVPNGTKLDELRAIAVNDGNLFVVNGAKSASNLLVFTGPPKAGPVFEYLDTVIGPGQSIMHPFGVAFQAADCYVSNQDSNVVAQVNLTTTHKGKVKGALGSGCQSSYLTTLYPAPAAFLDGTFVASQNGNLVGVAVVAPDVAENHGGLNVTPASTSNQPVTPTNSVRDVAIANGMLFVCDEVDGQINVYNLNGGAYLLSTGLNTTATSTCSPTHLAVSGTGLWVSAGENLFWSVLPTSTSTPSLSFQPVAIEVPTKNKIGGISFDNTGNVFVVFQDGTGGTGSGSIQRFTVTSGTPPTLKDGAEFTTLSADTPEFCLWVDDSHWPD